MADTKITALTALTAADPANDVIPIVDVSDTTMAASGTTKKISVNNILSSSPTASGALTVTGLVTAGSATITGDLTVDTSTLFVNSSNDRVGINTATPLSNLHVGSGTGLNNLGVGLSRGATTNFYEAFDGTKSFLAGTDSSQAGVKVGSLTNHPLYLVSNNTSQLDITHPGIFVFNDGAGGTRMTLNSTGLGVGGSPNAKVSCAGYSSANVAADFQINRSSSGTGIQTGPNLTFADGTTNNTVTIQNSQGRFGIWNYGAGAWNERLSVDTSGNVGIGVTPRAKLDVNGGLLVNNYITSTNYAPLSVTTASTITTPSTFTNAINIWNPTTVGAYSNITFGYNILGLTNAPAYIGFVSTSSASGGFGDLVFGTRDVGTDTAAAERVRIDASGNLLVGTTGSLPSFANGRIEVLAVASSYCIVADATATSAAAIGVRGNDSTVAASFYNASTGGTVGSIVINSGGVSYNTTSDYRLKESVKPISGGLARVNALKPSVYNWKSNGSTGEGFLAHELAEVVPFAVSGEKDAMNADGTIKSQGIDMSRVVPILVAAIQELTARVQTLEAR